MDEDEFDTLVNASRCYGQEQIINGRFRYDGETIQANSNENGFAVYTGVDQGPIESLDTLNRYFPVRGNLHILSGEDYQSGNFTEVDGHSYDTYDTDEWDVVKSVNDDFGFFWSRVSSDHFPGREHQVAFFSNSEEYELSARSVEPIGVVLPEFHEGFDDGLTDELQAFALSNPENFNLSE